MFKYNYVLVSHTVFKTHFKKEMLKVVCMNQLYKIAVKKY